MVDLRGVLARVLVRRGVAAADLAARLAHAQVDPLVARLQALLAAGDVGGGVEQLDLVEMGALGHVRNATERRKRSDGGGSANVGLEAFDRARDRPGVVPPEGRS